MQWDREGKTDDTGGIDGQVTSLGTWGALGSCVDRPQSCAIQEMRQVEYLSTVVGLGLFPKPNAFVVRVLRQRETHMSGTRTCSRGTGEC